MNEVGNFVVLSESKLSTTSSLRGRAATSKFLALRCGPSPWRSPVVLFGLQYILKQWLVGPVVTKSAVEEAKAFLTALGLPFDDSRWLYIVSKHQGKLPVKISAPSEGAIGHNVMLLIQATDENCNWILQPVQNVLDLLWYPVTVATLSRSCKIMLSEFLEQTSTLPVEGTVEYQLFDFGFRGSTTVESAAIGGCAHLINFRLSATIAALQTARKFYHKDMAATAIPSAEHSTITTWGRDREADAYRNLMMQFPTGKLSCVSDSYDLFNACENIWGKELHDLVCSRNGKGTVCVRPDSGDPVTVVHQTIEILGSKFGYETNAKGYRVLPSYIRIIQGDGVSYGSIERILLNLKANGWSSENVTFGSGGALLQRVDRSMLDFEWLLFGADESGTPWIDRESEHSYEVNSQESFDWHAATATPNSKGLHLLFENGDLLRDFTMDQIRENVDTH